MEVKINIESNQIGDTVIDLFKNLSPEKKEELALSIMKEWLMAPEFFETKNKEQIIIQEFREGKRKLSWGRNDYNKDTPEDVILRDDNFRRAMEDYKNSKQILVEDIKEEVVSYYKKYISEQIVNHELINKIKEETYKEIAKQFPSIIMQVLVDVFCQNLTGMQSQIKNNTIMASGTSALVDQIMNRLR